MMENMIKLVASVKVAYIPEACERAINRAALKISEEWARTEVNRAVNRWFYECEPVEGW